MSFNDCIAEIRAAAGGGANLSDRDIEQMLENVMQRARRKAGETGRAALDRDTLREAGREVADEARLSALVEKRNAQLNMLARIGRRDRIAAAPDLVTGFMAEIHGVNTPMFGGRNSAQAEWKSQTDIYWSGLTKELERAGLYNSMRRGLLAREWARELFELSKGKDGNPGISGSPEALTIAKIVHKYQTLAKEDQNRAGAWIGDYQGYITRTSHDPDKIRLAGAGNRLRNGATADDLAAWKDFIRPLLDERTFDYVGPSPEARERFLDNVYHALITGVHLTHDGLQGFKDPAFTGPANLANRLSQERVLHFRDADAWLDYHDRFGRGSLLANVLSGLDRSARATALMKRFGTNPRAEFAADLRYFLEDNRNANPTGVLELKNKQPYLQRAFDFLDGTADIPVNRLAAKIGSAVRLDESMAHLGAVALTHLSVGMTRAAELRHHGVGLLESYGDYLRSFIRGPRGRGADEREMADLLHAGIEGTVRDLRSRFDPDDGIPGRLSSLANRYFKATGLTYMLNAMRTGHQFALARRLGSLLDRAYADLPEANRQMLSAYRVTPEEWELLRQAPDPASLYGKPYLTPDLAQRIPDTAALQHLFNLGKIDVRGMTGPSARAVDAFRDDLALRLHGYLHDSTDRGIITPGVREKAILLRGWQPGTPEGEIARFFAQFKMWPTALITQGLGREWNTSLSRPAAIAGILHMMVAGTVFGYLRMVIADEASGKNPRDPRSPPTLFAALAQGGGLGIFGDFFFGEASRMGGGVASTFAGPVIGQAANTIYTIWNDIKEGRGGEIAPHLWELVYRQVPGINLFYLRLALNYLFLWQVQEALNPGFLRRFERRLRDQQGQTMWLSPSSVVESHPAPRPQQHAH